MAWNRTQLVAEAKAAADATNSSRWSNDTILRIGNIVSSKEWKGILEANKTYRYAKRTPSVDSTGRIAIADLSAAGERFFRVLALGDTAPWHEADFFPTDTDSVESSTSRVWFRTGSYIQLAPATTATGVKVHVNHRPALITDLGAGDDVEFPEGYEYILAFEMAATMLAKGGAETSEAAELRALAEQYRGEMLGEIQRMSTGQVMMGFSDERSAWAG